MPMRSSIVDFLFGDRKSGRSASVAKDRLQIIVAHERSQRDMPDFLPQLRQDLLEVISRYVAVDQDQFNISLDRDGGYEVLEMNIVLPESEKSA